MAHHKRNAAAIEARGVPEIGPLGGTVDQESSLTLGPVQGRRGVPQRTLQVLVPLIRADLKTAKAAADKAAQPYYIEAGAKLVEAREQVQHGEWRRWLQRHFHLSQESAPRYMRLADAVGKIPHEHVEFKSLSDAIRQHVDPNHNRARPEVNICEKGAELRDRREANRELALELIEAGYRSMAGKLHPDRGGTTDAMARLNHVRTLARDILRKAVFL